MTGGWSTSCCSNTQRYVSVQKMFTLIDFHCVFEGNILQQSYPHLSQVDATQWVRLVLGVWVWFLGLHVLPLAPPPHRANTCTLGCWMCLLTLVVALVHSLCCCLPCLCSILPGSSLPRCGIHLLLLYRGLANPKCWSFFLLDGWCFSGI